MIESISFRGKGDDYEVVNFYFNEGSIGIDFNGNEPMVSLDADDLDHITRLFVSHLERIKQNKQK
jgi:hypothetical protein